MDYYYYELSIDIFKYKNYYEFKYFCIIKILIIISYNFKKNNLQNNKIMKINMKRNYM